MKFHWQSFEKLKATTYNCHVLFFLSNFWKVEVRKENAFRMRKLRNRQANLSWWHVPTGIRFGLFCGGSKLGTS